MTWKGTLCNKNLCHTSHISAVKEGVLTDLKQQEIKELPVGSHTVGVITFGLKCFLIKIWNRNCKINLKVKKEEVKKQGLVMVVGWLKTKSILGVIKLFILSAVPFLSLIFHFLVLSSFEFCFAFFCLGFFNLYQCWNLLSPPLEEKIGMRSLA